jgi:hypothetical protein
MRAALLLAVVVAVTACGGASAAGHTPIAFGITGGNLAPYHVTIQPNGSVRVRGSQRTSRRQIAPARVRRLRREIERAHLSSRRCGGVLPDIASRYVRAGGPTVTVHGGCDADFERVWNDLAQALGLRSASRF